MKFLKLMFALLVQENNVINSNKKFKLLPLDLKTEILNMRN